jgi:hypothetical protein
VCDEVEGLFVCEKIIPDGEMPLMEYIQDHDYFGCSIRAKQLSHKHMGVDGMNL